MPRTCCITATSKTWSRTRVACNSCTGRRLEVHGSPRARLQPRRDQRSQHVAVAGGTTSCETTYLRTNCTRPWSNLRAYPRSQRSAQRRCAEHPVCGSAASRFMKRDGFGVTLDLQYEASGFTRSTRSPATRTAKVSRPTRPAGRVGWDTAQRARRCLHQHHPATRPATSNNGQFLFALQPVGEDADVQQFSQEFRLTSNNPDSYSTGSAACT